MNKEDNLRLLNLYQLKLLKKHLHNNNSIICIDTEFIKTDKKNSNNLILLEVGYSIFHNRKQKTFHYIVKENININHPNEKFNNKDNFKFKSEIKSINEIKSILNKLIETNNFMFVGHGIKQDLNILNIKINKKQSFDTKYSHLYLERFKEFNNCISFESLLNSFDINYKKEELHNAGNDSFYFIKLINKFVKAKINN